jgi:TfoX/Sxy family transcriptional regulator of competence genes
MPVNPDFATYVLEQLGRLVPMVRARPMFGGVSISAAGGTFALIDDDVVYLKGGKAGRARFEAAGWPPFRPFGDEGSAMAYFAVPGEMLDDPERLRPWVNLALDAATQARRPKKR